MLAAEPSASMHAAWITANILLKFSQIGLRVTGAPDGGGRERTAICADQTTVNGFIKAGNTRAKVQANTRAQLRTPARQVSLNHCSGPLEEVRQPLEVGSGELLEKEV